MLLKGYRNGDVMLLVSKQAYSSQEGLTNPTIRYPYVFYLIVEDPVPLWARSEASGFGWNFIGLAK